MENELTHGTFNYPDRRESERDIEQPVTEHEHFEDYGKLAHTTLATILNDKSI